VGGTDNVGDHPKPIRSYSMVLAVFFNRIPKKWLSWALVSHDGGGLGRLGRLGRVSETLPKISR